MVIKKFLLILSFLTTGTNALAAAPITLETGSGKQVRSENLSCAGRITAIVRLPGGTSGTHRLEGLWYRPGKTLQEHAALKIDFPAAAGPKSAALWMEFSPPQTTPFDEFSFGSPATPEKNEFDGIWRLLVLLDGRALGEKSFSVTCTKGE